MKTIQIIDLFNMYARGGQQVKSIIYKDKNYIYDGNSVLSQLMSDYKNNILYLLNDNVKLIENPNDILSDLLSENKKYKEVINKAIKYIEENKQHEYRNGNLNEYYLELNEKEMMEFLDILKEVEHE